MGTKFQKTPKWNICLTNLLFHWLSNSMILTRIIHGKWKKLRIFATDKSEFSMIKDIILVGIGSGIGGICRYLISLAMTQARNGFPWGTFTINVAGCLLIGILWGATSRFQNVSPSFSLFLMVGFCGGFTTFSTFSKEGLTMLQADSYILFSLYAIGSMMLGILAVALGYYTTR